MIDHNITWVNISKSALLYNIKKLKSVIGNKTELMPIIKSNAYGHGFTEISNILNSINTKWIGTVNLNEALKLKKNKITSNIIVLSFYNPKLLTEAIKKNIRLTVYTYGAALEINKAAKKIRKKANIHIKVDTGTSRLGFLADEAIKSITKIAKLSNINIEGIFSHLSDAENINQSITKLQNSRFKKILTELQKNRIYVKYKHLACSAALILNKNIHYDLVRSGISIYGLHSILNGQKKHINLKPVLSWHTKIIQIKTIPKSSYVGYNRSYKTNKKTKIALIPVGYWDGFDRKLSNNGFVLINGTKCKILGNICMNLTIVEVTKLSKVRTGDEVILIGQQGKHSITVDDIAEKIGTINYEVVTRINPFIKRIIIK